MRYRKNIECLTSSELHDLREAFAGLYALPPSDPNSFHTLASFHGGPPTSYCIHGSPGFFTWHRAYLMAIENALRTIRCDVTLPYWDWSSGPTTGVPGPCRNPTYVNRSGATVPNPLYSGPRAAGGMTVRAGDVNTRSYAAYATQAQNALAEPTFANFQNQINPAHGGVHVNTGGDMQSVATASYDPIFYFHHCNVDRLWAEWQQAHPGTALPSNEQTFELPPFARPYTREWQRGAEVESTTALGYRYLRICFVLPPIRLFEAIPITWDHHVGERIEAARLSVATRGTNSRPVEIRAFVDQPEATVRTQTAGNPSFAGSFGLMAHAPMKETAVVEAPPKAKAAAAAPRGQVVLVVEGDRTRTVEQSGHGEDGHSHGEEGHTHTHAEPEPVAEPTPTASHGDAHKIVLELGLTKAFQARKGKATLKLVAVDADGREVREADIGIDHFHFKME